MRRKSIEEILSFQSAADLKAELDSLADHANLMGAHGRLSPSEMVDLLRYGLRKRRDNSEEYDRLSPEDRDQLEAFGGYEDDEDPDEVDARREAVHPKVKFDRLFFAVFRGLMDIREALSEASEHGGSAMNGDNGQR
jgi:hypothetical protein